MSDYHIHLYEHGARREAVTDGVQHIERYVEAAANRGVTDLGFTEHLYRCHEAQPVLGPFWEAEPRADLAAQAAAAVAEDLILSLDEYVGMVEAAKERGLPVRLGLEVDVFPESIEAVTEFLAPYPWDFLIGSVHWIGGWAVDDDRAGHEFDRRGVDQAYEDFFALEAALAGSGSVDVLAHVDVVKKHGHRPARERFDLYDPVVAAAAASGTAVEVSSAGLFKPVGEIYPAPALLAMFFEAGVGITLASDAHRPEDAARAHEEAVAAARLAGYTQRLRFDSRRASLVDL